MPLEYVPNSFVFTILLHWRLILPSHQKSSIENANRLLRRYCPRKGDINSLTQAELDAYVKQINERPLKCLGYRTPSEVYLRLAVEELKKSA